MAKIKKAQLGGCLSTTGSGTRTKLYKSAAGEGGSGSDRRAARQFARAERKMDKAAAKLEREEAKAKAKAPKGKAGLKVKKAKAGKEMIKRADGSYSQRGLWDNIRANKGSGKKPTAQMLKQEKKIKAKSKK